MQRFGSDRRYSQPREVSRSEIDPQARVPHDGFARPVRCSAKYQFQNHRLDNAQTIGSYCLYQTFADAALNDRLWS
jgi:hypothetical protein